MNDDDDRHSRPSTAHWIGDTESAGSPSPTKHLFSDNKRPPASSSAKSNNLRPENIPPLHPSSALAVPESSYFDSPSGDLRHSDSQAEIAVRQHLQDIESSFDAPLSPIPSSNNGLDDTFVFDSPSKKPTAPLPKAPADPDESQVLPVPSRAASGTSNNADVSELTESGNDEEQEDTSKATRSLEAFSSSPTAAAAARTISRAVSEAMSTNAETSSARTDPLKDEREFNHSAESSLVIPPTDQEPVQPSDSDTNWQRASIDTGSTHSQTMKSASRPKFLRSRNASQRSSVSSTITDPESDNTMGMGADYALQSGGAVPSLGMPRNFNSILSRTISMGSMASGIDDMHDNTGPVSVGHLETLDEVDSSLSPQPQPPPHRRAPRVDDEDEDDDVLRTPTQSKSSAALAAPTDTVLARHVRDVHVPESLAKEYKTKGGLTTPGRSVTFDNVNLGASTTSRHGKSLTLKEQSSTIERLSKENFDLKLKVMFLSDRLDKLSEEGIKEMISENVELKTGLAVLQRDNKVLRRRVKELEKQLKDEDERPGTAKSSGSDDEDAHDREEELIYLREQMEEYVTEIERLRNDNLNREAEKRKMAELVKTLGERAGERMGENLGRQEEADVWKDLLEQETARREQSDEDNRRLRDEVFRLKQEMAQQMGLPTSSSSSFYHNRRHPPISPAARPPTASFSSQDMDNATVASVTLVDDLRRESEQLRHENAELRREVGAQTSMLTSRNREKERLYQEIEDLKMAQRRGGPAPSTIDSLLERSASRAGVHERSQSRISGGATTVLDDLDRDELEERLAELRDKNNELKLQNQDLQRELDACMEDFETAVEAKKQAEELVAALQEDIDAAMNDLMALQAERDEALQEHANLEAEFEALRKEAQEEIDALEGEADQRTGEIERLQLDLNDRTENFDALQEEMRKMSDALVRLEDEQESKIRRITQLEQELGDANKELEELEVKLLEANDKANRLSVQQESSQGEIAFLREEQEGDKIRIGDLEAALANVEQSLRDEKDRARELEQRLAAERRQREIVANKEKEEVQQFVNELNREASTAKDEARRLRKSLTSREVEATEWKERLLELENNLREALGDLSGTRSSLLKVGPLAVTLRGRSWLTLFQNIAKMQRDLENTVRDLDSTKASLVEKDRIIKQRDALLESHSHETRKLVEMLDKERAAHRNVKNQFETFQKTHSHVTRTVSSQDSRIMELEAQKAADKKRISQLESSFKEQLTERNNLLLILWTRLSTLCGSDWAHDNSLINGRALPSLEAVSTMLPGFSKNLMAAVKMIETMIGNFQTKIKSVEKDLWKEYQTLEGLLDQRTKKLDRVESIVRNNIATGQLSGHSHASRDAEKLARLEEAYRQLKVECHTLRMATEVRARQAYAATGDPNGLQDPTSPTGGSPSPSVPTGPKAKSRIPKTGSRGSSLGRTGGPVPSRSSSQFHSHSSRTHLAADEFGMLSPDGNSNNNNAANSNGTTPHHTDNESPTSPLPQTEKTPRESSTQQAGSNTASVAGSQSGQGGQSMENKWMLRLRDLEYKLKAEREGRILDRGEAMKRINASESENMALRENLERERRRQMQLSQQGDRGDREKEKDGKSGQGR
ncbi:hypothetical protein B0T21DRAFT_296622 [Apiosordaria backusii]|uniref:Anucleate primary sterigmata protein B n=1 Tax=Apiosordaria backusii TaxID=314023 RepID=A0AA40AIY9_9PEZI|nr:hypothetical protein B0T21DRAFT_296622 [Apiosordaria backusii]